MLRDNTAVMPPYECIPDSCSYLDPDYRRPLILLELLGFHADIICLQEMDEKAFSEYFLPQLQQAGEGEMVLLAVCLTYSTCGPAVSHIIHCVWPTVLPTNQGWIEYKPEVKGQVYLT